jgi:hypothetical protein
MMEFQGAKPKVGNLALAPELMGIVSAAVDELDRAIQSAELQRDPLRHALKALATHLNALHRVLTEATLTIGAQLDEAKRPIAAEDLKRLGKVAADGAWHATAGLVQAHIWRTILIGPGATRLIVGQPPPGRFPVSRNRAQVVAFTIAASLMIARAVAGTPIYLAADPPKAKIDSGQAYRSGV